ncbi:hypothetical protein [Brevundimonas sp.]|uniref:hypothetical protein n=1 Tax=Brevundimonas sp. TaxID=1871086 RepID=UPI0025E6B835|nr:hypothetical protein [Brevundimonas sp.]
MRNPLVLIAAVAAAGLGLSACDMTATDREEDVAPPPPVEEPVVEVEEEEEAPAEPTDATPPPPARDTGDMGEARPSEESVQPDSETVFY